MTTSLEGERYGEVNRIQAQGDHEKAFTLSVHPIFLDFDLCEGCRRPLQASDFISGKLNHEREFLDDHGGEPPRNVWHIVKGCSSKHQIWKITCFWNVSLNPAIAVSRSREKIQVPPRAEDRLLALKGLDRSEIGVSFSGDL